MPHPQPEEFILMDTKNKMPDGTGRERIDEQERLTAALTRMFGAEAVGPWFDSPNPAFGGLKPIEVIERGESDRLWQMIFELRSGSHV
jgi:hypothetical protein